MNLESPDKATFIRENLLLQPVPDLPHVQIYTAHPKSRLSRLGGEAPYWAYLWAGGAALARYVSETGVAQGRRVLDFGAGSGVVGIAAAKAGAAGVWAVDADPWALAAVGVNAAANGVVVGLEEAEPDLVLCGDVFYDKDVAGRVMPLLDGFLARGIEVLVGDPGRVGLPLGPAGPAGRISGAGYGIGRGQARQGGGLCLVERGLTSGAPKMSVSRTSYFSDQYQYVIFIH